MRINSVLIIGTPIIATSLSGAILASTYVSANDVVDQVSITAPVSCSLSGTGMNTHNAEINNGQYNSAIGETTIKAFCNDNEGFAIYAIGYTDDTDGKNVLTSSALGSTYDIATGTATSGNISNWAMKLSTISTPTPTPTYPITIQNSFDSFQEIPDDYTLVAKRTSSTDIGTSAEGSTVKSTYQAYINQTQPAGTYTGQVKYTLVHPNNATAPERPVACNSAGTTVGTNTSTDIICMQDITSTNRSTVLTSMTEDQQYTLTDKRDGKTYTVAKLKDGNIWMTQNLDLDLDSAKTYTNEDTDLGWNTSTNSYDAASWTPDESTLTNSNRSSWSNAWDYYTLKSYDPGNLYWNGVLSSNDDWTTYQNSCSRTSYGTGYEYTNCDESLNPINAYVSTTGKAQYHLGNYYNWVAAIAYNTEPRIGWDIAVEQSVCPAG